MHGGSAVSSPRVLFVSTYPPTACGLASFTQATVRALTALRGGPDGVMVARVRPSFDAPGAAPEVAVDLTVLDRSWPRRIARVADDFDVLWIQHEFGIFGPSDGRRVLELSDAASIPLVTTFHTALSRPSPHQRRIVTRLLARSHTAVVMSATARNRLAASLDVRKESIEVIPHGAFRFPGHQPTLRSRPTITTWGLLGPGKGIEWGIEAMAHLRHLRPSPRYLIRGGTHPNVVRAGGEAYRTALARRVAGLGLADLVDIQDGYMSHGELAGVVAQSDIVLIPYDSSDQVTSGVLVEAVAAGLPVVATAFPHAVELLSEGPGLVVPHRDPVAIAVALETLLTDPAAYVRASHAARRLGATLSWTTVAGRYERVASEATASTHRLGASAPAS